MICSFRNDTYDKVKSIALEGSLMTLVGKISYDIALDEFQLYDGVAFVAGGIEELVKHFESQREILNEGTTLFYLLTVGISIYIAKMIVSRIHKYRVKAAFNQRLKHMLMQKSSAIVDKCAIECKICLEYNATVILAPCNHQVVCEYCY